MIIHIHARPHKAGDELRSDCGVRFVNMGTTDVLMHGFDADAVVKLGGNLCEDCKRLLSDVPKSERAQ